MTAVPAASDPSLPRPLTRLFGRARERALLAEVLARPGPLLVTLTGPGGTGKTRLAIEAARDRAESGEARVVFVELGPLAPGSTGVGAAVAAALALGDAPDALLLDRLAGPLAARATVLVLDNCEHLLDACADLVAALLRRCPPLRVLATSRAPLGVPGEEVLPVPPLSLPAPDGPAAADADAVRLFEDRARLRDPSFTLAPAHAAAVAAICRRLDGLPLAIELAAARVSLLSPAQIAGRLDDRFRLLAGGARGLPARQQSLWAAIDWSYELLTEAERVVFARLSVFAGGFTVEAAEAVAGDGLPPGETLDVLARLVAQSLVVRLPARADGEEPRLGLLESLGAFARDRLEERGERPAAARRHAAFFLDLAEQAAAGLDGPERARWRVRLGAEHLNLRAALRTLGETLTVEPYLRLAAALWPFWLWQGTVTQGRAWLAAAALPAPATPAGIRAAALTGAGMLALAQSDYAEARALLARALDLYRAAGAAPETVAAALIDLASVLLNLHQFDEANRYLDDALDLARAARAVDAESRALLVRVAIEQQTGRLAEARAHGTACLALCRALDRGDRAAACLNALAVIALSADEPERARPLFEESLTLARAEEDTAMVARCTYNLGTLERQAGRLTAAWQRFRDCLAVFRDLGDRQLIGATIGNLGFIAEAAGVADVAAVLLGAAEEMREPYNIPMTPAIWEEYRAVLGHLQATLGAAAFAAAQRQGALMPLDRVILYALAAPEPAPPPAVAASAPTAVRDEVAPASVPEPAPEGLSPREVEVLRRIAAGESAKEIAVALRLSVRTVERHTQNIYNKIGARGRADAVAFAFRHDLDR